MGVPNQVDLKKKERKQNENKANKRTTTKKERRRRRRRRMHTQTNIFEHMVMQKIARSSSMCVFVFDE